jgi:hypothetical protein
MKHSIDLIYLQEINTDIPEVRNLIQVISANLKIGRSRIMPVRKIELGQFIRELGEGYASKKGELNWTFSINYGQSTVILSTPIHSQQ